MARRTSFSLGDRFRTFVEGQLARGRYSDASEVVREGLRLVESRETDLAALRAAPVAGERSGPATTSAPATEGSRPVHTGCFSV